MACRSSVLVLVASLLALSACKKEDLPGGAEGALEGQAGVAAPAEGGGPASSGSSESAPSKKLPSGIEFRVLRPGSGAAPRLGSAVTAHIRGSLPNGKVFMDTRKDGFPKTYKLDKLHLVSGLVETFLTMQKGEKREVLIPADLAYGAGGYTGVVPGNADLKFEIELVAIGTVAEPGPSPLR